MLPCRGCAEFSVVPGSESPLEPTDFDRDRERELALVVLLRRLIVRLYRKIEAERYHFGGAIFVSLQGNHLTPAR